MAGGGCASGGDEEAAPLLGAGRPAQEPAAAEKSRFLDALGPVASTLLCLPVLVAHWCWPALLATALGMAVSKETLIYSYVFTFAVLLAVMTNTCQYFARHPPRKGTWWGCNGPLVLLSLATLFLLVAPLKNLVVNVCMQSFRENGYDSTIEAALDFAYKPCFKYVQAYTIVAYVFMIWGTALQVDIFSKFQSKLQAEVARAESRLGAQGEPAQASSGACSGGVWH